MQHIYFLWKSFQHTELSFSLKWQKISSWYMAKHLVWKIDGSSQNITYDIFLLFYCTLYSMLRPFPGVILSVSVAIHLPSFCSCFIYYINLCFIQRV
jgi:hypothetical protein